MKNFWQTLPKPFLVLAPMEDVTDMVFREIVCDLPRPDVFFTEFTSADGLNSKGRLVTLEKFLYSEKQRPIVAQIWGTNLVNIEAAAATVQELGFDGIDINMGCPVRAVNKSGAGAAMAKDPALAAEVIAATKRGAPNIPISVKTRLGFNKINTEEWIGFLLKQNIHALTIHGRTATQQSTGDANWEEIGKAVKIAQATAPHTTIIGNGDIKSAAEALSRHKTYGVDGVMIGRGIFSNPWVFEKSEHPITHTRQEYTDLLLKHISLYVDTWGESKNFEIMKKFFKMYVNNFAGASQLRLALMSCRNKAQVEETLATWSFTQ